MKNQFILASECFTATPKKHFFLDFKRAKNNSRYIQITRSEQQADGNYKRWTFIVFEEDFEDFISSMTSLFQAMAYLDQGYKTIKECYAENRARGIKSMAEELRPREKMVANGATAMSDAELLGLLIGSGNPGETAVELGSRILKSFGDGPSSLKKADLGALCRFQRMGIAKASSVLAAMELGRRAYSPVGFPNAVGTPPQPRG